MHVLLRPTLLYQRKVCERIDKKNRKVADINVNDNSVIVGKALHNISKTTYSVIDLSSVIEN